MPGIVVFNRRWSVGSDDLVVPGVFLLILHIIWMIVLSSVLAFFDFGDLTQCILDLHEHMLGYIIILSGCIVVEACIAWVSMRGTILYTEPRTSMEYLLYVRLGFMCVELAWLILGVIWLVQHYATCPIGLAKEAMLGIIVCNWCVLLSVLITIWCTFDAAGRSWVKMKRYQRSLRDGRTKFNYKRSGSSHRDWRHRKVMRAYQESWNTRCRVLFCCMGKSDQHRNSFAEIAKLLSEFFRDLDVVPSDVIAGLVLLRKSQKLERQAIVAQRKNETYEFLSGIPITPGSKFLPLNDAESLDEFKNVIHYMEYAISAYGWPMYVMANSATGICRLVPHLRCCCCCCCCDCCGGKRDERVRIVDDNCCQCNYAALQKLNKFTDVDVVFVTYHVEVGETPFFVAVDHDKRKVVISIRGTLSMQDVITDLNAEGEQLPTEELHDDWLGHKGMVQAAEYIRRKLFEEDILAKAFEFDVERGTPDYDLVLVGHSLGAGTAAILAILLKQIYPNLHCYAYSPPGGLLSMPAVEYTKSFITSIVVGKDVVPRIGLHQMEALRSDLINAIKMSTEPKWKVIMQSMMCCGSEAELDELKRTDVTCRSNTRRNLTCHPSDSSIALTAHQPLYPPGKIIHIVRHHPSKETQKYEKKWRQMFKKNEPIYQAIWADNSDFDEVLISPVMIQDHMPDKVLEALEKVLSNVGPAKPHRVFVENEKNQLSPDSSNSSPLDRTPPHKLCLETSFTDLNPEVGCPTSNRSSTYSESGIDPLNASLSWEYPSALEDHMTRNSRQQKNVGFYPTTIGMPERRVNLLHDDWMGLAPLASPETLSDISSISSRGSRNNVNGGRPPSGLVLPTTHPMETIMQSPSTTKGITNANGGYCFYVDIPTESDSKPSSPAAVMRSTNHHRTMRDEMSDIHEGDEQSISETSHLIDAQTRNEATILDLDSDSEDTKYDLGRLTFLTGSEQSPQRYKENRRVGNGECACREMNLNIGSKSCSPLPNSPREKRVTFQIDQVNSTCLDSPKHTLCESRSPEPIHTISYDVMFPAISPQQEYGSNLYSPYPHYGYSNHSPYQSPTLDIPNLDLYQANLANVMSQFQESNTTLLNNKSEKLSDSSGVHSDDISETDRERRSDEDLVMPRSMDVYHIREPMSLSPDNPVKMFFKYGEFTEESSV